MLLGLIILAVIIAVAISIGRATEQVVNKLMEDGDD